MEERIIRIPLKDGVADLSVMAESFDQIGWSVTATAARNLQEHNQEISGEYNSPEEAITALQEYVKEVFHELIFTIAALEEKTQSSDQRIPTKVQLIYE